MRIGSAEVLVMDKKELLLYAVKGYLANDEIFHLMNNFFGAGGIIDPKMEDVAQAFLDIITYTLLDGNNKNLSDSMIDGMFKILNSKKSEEEKVEALIKKFCK